MTRYIEWGDYGVSASGYIQRDRSDSTLVDPASPESARALWAALPPDLRLALAKTAPSVLMPWTTQQPDSGALERRDRAMPITWTAAVSPDTEHIKARWVIRLRNGDLLKGAAETTQQAQSACDAALLAQGYVLDGDTP